MSARTRVSAETISSALTSTRSASASRHDEHAVELRDHDVARVHGDVGDRDGLLRGDHLPAPDRVERREVAVEDLEADLAQAFDVAEVAVEDAADAALLAGGVGRELAEVPDGARPVHVHEDRVRLELLEDLEVGRDPSDSLFPADPRVDGAAEHGERDARDPLLREEGAEPGGEHLLRQAELVQGVADGGHVELPVTAAELGSVQLDLQEKRFSCGWRV